MMIAIGSDHRGVDYKKNVILLLVKMGHDYKDFGSYTSDPVDYPDIARMVAGAVLSAQFDFGILICGTGIGMSIAANKVHGIRAALCCDTFYAKRARLHNNANIMCLGAERSEADVKDILDIFFNTQFEGGRHQVRLDKLHQIENDVPVSD